MKFATNFALVGTGLVLLLCVGLPAQADTPQTITNFLGMKLVLVPAGEFMMGAEEDRSDTLNYFHYCDPTLLDGELPRHKVRITQPFYLGQYEVTLGQFLKFYDDAKYKLDIERDGQPSGGWNQEGRRIESADFRPWAPIGWKIEMNHPVVYVSWNDATAFCKWISKKEAKTYRLPTEAEWEYACRAGSEDRYHFGDDPEELVPYSNCTDLDAKVGSEYATIASYKDGQKTKTNIPFPYLSRRDGYKWTAPVGKFQPNAFGLCDMHGNAWEWCSDWYGENYYAQSPAEDPQGPAAGSSRVSRGGGFGYPPVFLRCATRDYGVPSTRSGYGGFRVLCEE